MIITKTKSKWYAYAILDGLDRLTSVNEQGVNDHEGRLRLGSRARRVVRLERRKGVFGVLGQRFSQCSWVS